MLHRTGLIYSRIAKTEVQISALTRKNIIFSHPLYKRIETVITDYF